MRTFPMSFLNKNPGAAVDEALQGPITLTRRERRTVVMLSVEEYERLINKRPAVQAYTVENMPADVRAEFLEALAADASDKSKG
jgi:PHD/YefM family antitoxin component YafN of YafNO toxin-antitoxin module